MLFSLHAGHVFAQRVIEYQSGMGSRDASDPAVWILYHKVRAMHEGMVLYSDSARLNTQRNDFTAFGNIRIELTDTTVIYGDRLYYDGEQRLLDIWSDTVVLVDGATTLKSPKLSYDRNTSMAYYSLWGHTVNQGRTLLSREGYYNSDSKTLNIYQQVMLYDSSMRLETDTLLYNTNTNIASFVSPTYIFNKTATIYSERGYYHSDSGYAVSNKASRIETDNKVLTCDSLHYMEHLQHGEAFGNVSIIDTQNHVICSGQYGETNRQSHCSFVTDSALVRMAERQDTLYMHADTIRVFTDTNNQLLAVQAFRRVKFFRHDVQGMSDSVYYHVTDSLMRLFYEPVLWYDNYQCSSDSIDVLHDTAGVRRAELNGHSTVNQQVDVDKFNQLKGKRSVVYFQASEPLFADILGNAQMVYYVTETDSLGHESLIGVNAGEGADMRIYFRKRQPHRLVAYGSPDMNTYPLEQLPPELRYLADFKWLSTRRPRSPQDVYRW
ncbi:MAG: hypothetical protein IJ764_07800 [Bacteroidales bacterium]|nr:hypothetical protein [Bacteroidales bacterium]